MLYQSVFIRYADNATMAMKRHTDRQRVVIRTKQTLSNVIIAHLHVKKESEKERDTVQLISRWLAEIS